METQDLLSEQQLMKELDDWLAVLKEKYPERNKVVEELNRIKKDAQLGRSIQAKTFKECVPKMIAHQKRSHPEFSNDQAVAVAYSKCRKMFGIKKANLLRLVQTGEIFQGKSLDSMISTITKSMTRDDWIDYGVLLKLEGKQNKEITSMIPYKDSWIKKYVNPIYNQVTPDDSIGANIYAEVTNLPEIVTSEPPKPPRNVISIGIKDLKKEKREFSAWGSVEVKDSHGDIISMEAIEAVMPVVMERGGVIMYGHSNKHVGKLNKYKITTKNVNGIQIPAIWLEGRIFNHFEIDKMAWEAIQIAKKTGQPVLSLGATPTSPPVTECDQNSCHKKYNDLEIYEWTITAIQKGSTGANPEAKVEMTKAIEEDHMEKAMTFDECVSRMEKRPEVTDPKKLCGWIYHHVPGAIKRSDHPIEKIDKDDAEVQKMMKDNTLIAGKLLKMKQEGTIPDSDNELVNLLLATCGACQEEYLALTKAGKTDQEARELILKDIVNTMTEIEKEIQEINKDAQAQPETTKQDETVQKEGDLGQMMEQIKQFFQEILARLPEREEPAVAPPEEQKSAEPKKDTNTMTLAKDLSPDEIIKIAKAQGFTVIRPEIQPTELKRELLKDSEKKPKRPTKEEMAEAVRTQSISELAEQYGYSD